MKFILLFGVLIFSAKRHVLDKSRGVSGIYGTYNEVSLAIDHDSVTGVYQYYDKWDEKRKEFIDINVFLFQGRFISDSVVTITAGWPKLQKLTGKIIFLKDSSITIFLNGQPYGYNDVNFASRTGVNMKIKKIMPWQKIELLKEKTRLFNAPDSSSIRKGYLVDGDIIKVVNSKETQWKEIDYSSPGDLGKNSRFWIRMNLSVIIGL